MAGELRYTYTMRSFEPKELDKLYKRTDKVDKGDSGQVTIIGGSDLFHGPPLFTLKTASRIVDMVYFSSPEPSVGDVVNKAKAQLGSFIWVPWDEVEAYIEKSDAVLIGPGFKRWHKENAKFKIKNSKLLDEAGTETKFVTKKLLKKFPTKKWVIDGGSLQVMETSWIPESAILSPNRKEFRMLFGGGALVVGSESGSEDVGEFVREKAKEHNCVIVLKAPTNIVCSAEECVEVTGGNPGMTKGGTGDVLAGVIVGLLAKNGPFLAAVASSWVVKRAADLLYERVGTAYNADDLAEEVPLVLGEYLK